MDAGTPASGMMLPTFVGLPSSIESFWQLNHRLPPHGCLLSPAKLTIFVFCVPPNPHALVMASMIISADLDSVLISV